MQPIGRQQVLSGRCALVCLRLAELHSARATKASQAAAWRQLESDQCASRAVRRPSRAAARAGPPPGATKSVGASPDRLMPIRVATANKRAQQVCAGCSRTAMAQVLRGMGERAGRMAPKVARRLVRRGRSPVSTEVPLRRRCCVSAGRQCAAGLALMCESGPISGGAPTGAGDGAPPRRDQERTTRSIVSQLQLRSARRCRRPDVVLSE
jgi:hypothetical protein